MTVVCLLGFLCGITLGCRYRVYVLIPALGAGALAALSVAFVTHLWLQTLGGFFVWGLTLQAAYAATILAAPWFNRRSTIVQRTT